MIENPITTLAACAAAAPIINLAILKFSPDIKSRVRHTIAGAGPAIATLAGHIGLQDSVVATGTDLLVLGGSAVVGFAAAIGSTKFVTPQRQIPNG